MRKEKHSIHQEYELALIKNSVKLWLRYNFIFIVAYAVWVMYETYLYLIDY